MLHQVVPKSHWGVTRHDLKDFRCRVVTAIRAGVIRPTERDGFDPQDGLVGPNVYTVNEQFIKPVTRDAGMMSWALMLHARGLKCDLFITHAWVEGIFEFLDKVLHSWPPGARGAYCCMLANPQNLDVSDLIRNPRESPFAEALASARCLLVIPNRQVSVYMRLWCAYEAYLAYRSSKMIIVARHSNFPEIVRSCGSAALAGCLGFAAGKLRWQLCGPPHKTVFERGLWWSYWLPLTLSSFSASRTVRRVSNLLTAAGFAYSSMIIDLPLGGDFGLWLRVIDLLGVCYSIQAEADSVRSQDYRHELQQLEQGYTGSIQDAECSDEHDDRTIRTEIGPSLGAVNDAIHALIKAGAWSKKLQSAQQAGVEIRDAAHIELAFPIVAVCFYFCVGCMFLQQKTALGCAADELCMMVQACALLVLPACQIALAVASPRTEVAFGISVVTKLALPGVCVSAATTSAWFLTDVFDRCGMYHVQGWNILFWGWLGLGLCAAGIHRVARQGRLGRLLAQILISRCEPPLGAVRRGELGDSDLESDTSEVSSQSGD